MKRCYAGKIASIELLSNWGRLKVLRLYSLEQRREGYDVLYVWMDLEGLVSNSDLESYTSPRTGFHCTLTKSPMYYSTIEFNGMQLFNILLHVDISDLHGAGLNIFKKQLDILLSKITDEPSSQLETQQGVAISNTVLHQKPIKKE